MAMDEKIMQQWDRFEHFDWSRERCTIIYLSLPTKCIGDASYRLVDAVSHAGRELQCFWMVVDLGAEN